MIRIAPSKHGRPGDLVVVTPPARLAATALQAPTKSFLGQPVYDLGLALEEGDLKHVRAAMLGAFATAFPDATGTPRLPIRPIGGRPVLWVETMKPPICLDGADRPIDPPLAGDTAKVMFRLCPYHRNPNRQGVGAYLVKLKVQAT